VSRTARDTEENLADIKQIFDRALASPEGIVLHFIGRKKLLAFRQRLYRFRSMTNRKYLEGFAPEDRLNAPAYIYDSIIMREVLDPEYEAAKVNGDANGARRAEANNIFSIEILTSGTKTPPGLASITDKATGAEIPAEEILAKGARPPAELPTPTPELDLDLSD